MSKIWKAIKKRVPKAKKNRWRARKQRRVIEGTRAMQARLEAEDAQFLPPGIVRQAQLETAAALGVSRYLARPTSPLPPPQPDQAQVFMGIDLYCGGAATTLTKYALLQNTLTGDRIVEIGQMNNGVGAATAKVRELYGRAFHGRLRGVAVETATLIAPGRSGVLVSWLPPDVSPDNQVRTVGIAPSSIMAAEARNGFESALWSEGSLSIANPLIGIGRWQATNTGVLFEYSIAMHMALQARAMFGPPVDEQAEFIEPDYTRFISP